MISHELRCIFIHIPRCGGTSIESSLCGQDWWSKSPQSKHLIASQARELYADYWASYYKFSIVRNPWARMISTLKFPNYFSEGHDPKTPEEYCQYLSGYRRKFGQRILVEYDYRHHKRPESESGLENAVYLNILDQELDFIGRYEDLEGSFAEICRALGLRRVKSKIFARAFRKVGLEKIRYLPHAAASAQGVRSSLRSARSDALVENLYRRDIEHFGYDCPEGV